MDIHQAVAILNQNGHYGRSDWYSYRQSFLPEPAALCGDTKKVFSLFEAVAIAEKYAAEGAK